METSEITTISEYIRFVEENCDTDDCLFRGQCSDYSLLPKVARIKHRGNILDVERKMVEQFKRYSRPYLTRIPLNDWEWLSFAQHHGMATRLLDWTLNPLAALWFACERPCIDDYGVIWIFDPPKSDILKPMEIVKQSPFEGLRTKIFQPDFLLARIQSQLGWFTVHKYIDDKKKFVPLEKNKIYKNCLRKIIIPAKCFSGIRYQLDRVGINRMALFPDLDGIARHVEWLHSFDEDEDYNQIKNLMASK